MSVIFCTGFSSFSQQYKKITYRKKSVHYHKKNSCDGQSTTHIRKIRFLFINAHFLTPSCINVVFFHPNTGKPYVIILRYEKKSLPQTIFRTPFTIYWIRNGIYLFRMVILRIKSFCVVNMTHLFLNFSVLKGNTDGKRQIGR